MNKVCQTIRNPVATMDWNYLYLLDTNAFLETFQHALSDIIDRTALLRTVSILRKHAIHGR